MVAGETWIPGRRQDEYHLDTKRYHADFYHMEFGYAILWVS